jgi:hypothetical protein
MSGGAGGPSGKTTTVTGVDEDGNPYVRTTTRNEWF